MQTSKARNGLSELSAKKCPVTPKSSRASSSESDTAGSKRTPKKITIERSPKSINRQSPKSPLVERKRPTKLNELECQISQLKEELKKAKDQLSSSESSKKQLEEEASEIKKQLIATSSRLEESKLQLVEFSKAEDARLQELRKIAQERDKSWQSELEALQQQHSIDSATLLSSMNEIQKLKQQIDMAMKSEADHSKDHDTAQIELDALKKDMAAALHAVQNLNAKIREKEMAEEEAKIFISETQKQLEMANATIETLRTEGSDLLEYLNSTSSKLEESRVRVSALEEMVKELQADLEGEDVEKRKLLHTTDSGSSHSELVQLRAALEAAEARYQEEQIRNTMEIQSAYEMAECVKVKAGMRETELVSTLGMTKSEISDLKVRLLDKETALQSLSEMNEELNQKMEDEKANQFDSELKLMRATTDLTELKANLLDKERELQGILEENALLKLELGKREIEHQNNLAVAISDAEKARAAEKDALSRVDFVNGEVEKNNSRAAKVMEQLVAAQAVNSEMDAELRRLRVQSDQWRKAAEAAAAVLSPGINCRAVDRTGSLDSDYSSISGKLMNSPFSDELDDESPKKKNGNMLRKIGGLWKKGPK